MIVGHGDDAFAYPFEIKEDFSSNVPFLNSSSKIIEQLQGRCASVSHYPDPSYRNLRLQVADHHGVSASQVLITNGSAEAFYLLAHFFARQRALIAIPSFAEYEDACWLYHHSLEYEHLTRIADSSLSNKDTVWLGLPNNPDGYMLPQDRLKRWVELFPQTFFIVDTAYRELSSESYDTSEWVHHFPNWIEVHSLTKTFAIPGIRLGYILASDSIIESVEQYRIPWSVNALAVEAGLYIMSHYKELQPPLSELLLGVRDLYNRLFSIEGVRLSKSSTSFLLGELSWGNSLDLKNFLAERYVCLIRSAHNFRGLSDKHFRVATRTPQANALLAHGISEYLRSTASI